MRISESENQKISVVGVWEPSLEDPFTSRHNKNQRLTFFENGNSLTEILSPEYASVKLKYRIEKDIMISWSDRVGREARSRFEILDKGKVLRIKSSRQWSVFKKVGDAK